VAVPVIIPLREILAALDEHTHYLTSHRSRFRRQFAAAGLARCRALLEGICVLIDAGRRDVTGILTRALAEAWLVALYVLYKGKGLDDESVLLEIFEGHARWAIPLAEKHGNKLPWGDMLAERKGPKGKAHKLRKLNLADVAKALQPLLEASPIRSGNAIDVYDRMIGFESLFSVHAGLGTFQDYLTLDESDENSPMGVVETPPTQKVLWREVAAANLTLNLARHVYRAFGIQVSPGFVAAELQFAKVAAGDPLGGG
jgi:hypothetical protein